ncbi:winged helix-turn-helix domain-containing protein [Tsukamurella soli]|uniref:HTH gntR-type domain-containing protein n=1 Tax=Tsukamurella soli TaxID=644556 RepID=A0ABP8JJY1_9ACTN
MGAAADAFHEVARADGAQHRGDAHHRHRDPGTVQPHQGRQEQQRRARPDHAAERTRGNRDEEHEAQRQHPNPFADRPRRMAGRPGTTLYRQVAEDLRSRIDHSEPAPGERLVPEARLAPEYGVNRLTMRRALEELARAGVLRTEHGGGQLRGRAAGAPPNRRR